MNERERYLATIHFDTPDRVPLSPGGGRKSTLEAWHAQGLPEDIGNLSIGEYAYREVGGTIPFPTRAEGFSINERMVPYFEEKVIERKGDTQIVQDWKGNICEISSKYTTEYLRNAIDFVTRRWIKCPVENRDDWESMKKRYDADDPSRLPENPEKLGKRLADREYPITFGFSGPFWQLREWLGFEGLCEMFYDDPDFVKDMIDFWQNHVSRLLERALSCVIPDEVHLSEDMAYKSFSMISPDMVREFLLPAWSKWGQIIRDAGVPNYGMDSDGFIGELIPIWIEAGINVCDPIEVAAGNDINDFRKRFGKNMAYRGGVDKRAMAKGGKVIIDEISRLRPVIDDGGYIPSCDHGIPADVSWPNFLSYMKLLTEATRWL